MDKKVIIINAPPRSGKDYLGEALTQRLSNAVVVKFAEYLKEATHRLYGFVNRKSDYYEDMKDVPNRDFFGLTPREAYIAVSEQYFKPVHSTDFFGRILARKILYSSYQTHIVTDGGFVDEVLPLVEKIGANNVLIIHLHRKDTSFKEDSRQYITVDGVQTVEFKNTEDQFILDIDQCIVPSLKKWINESSLYT